MGQARAGRFENSSLYASKDQVYVSVVMFNGTSAALSG